MGFARWMSWSAWETDKLRRYQQTTAEYQSGWERGQVSLLAELMHERTTLDAAEVYLAAHPPRPPAWQYGQGWHAGQIDLLQALRTGQITVAAAAVRLGMVLQHELRPEAGNTAGGPERAA